MSDSDAENSTMVSLTWDLIESLGVPDSRARRAFVEIAQIAEAGEELALVSRAYLELHKSFREAFEPKSPLEIVRDHQRALKELAELLGTPVDRPLRAEDLELPPVLETPQQVAEHLGYRDGGRAVRRVLRQGFPDHPAGRSWVPLTLQRANYVLAHLPRRQAHIS